MILKTCFTDKKYVSNHTISIIFNMIILYSLELFKYIYLIFYNCDKIISTDYKSEKLHRQLFASEGATLSGINQ